MNDAPAQTHPPAAPRFYQATNRVGAQLGLWLPVAGGIGVLVLGTVYAFLSYLVGQVFESPPAHILITPFFAAGLVMLGLWICQLGDVRWRQLRLPVVLLVGVMGLYASWHVYLNFASSPKIFNPLPAWHMSPLRLWHALRDLADDRSAWSWVWWLLEAATVFGGIVYLMADSDPEVPFCEQCGQWTRQVFYRELGNKPDVAVVEEFKRGHVEVLERLGDRDHSTSTYVQLRVLNCPCGASRYACVERVTVKPGTKSEMRFGSVTPGGRAQMHWHFGNARAHAIAPLVVNMAIDDAMQEKLEALETGRRKQAG
jgi:hypothetical protein